MDETAVHGNVAPGFERVLASFARGFERDELGGAVCAYVDGRKVVDLWGGWADAARTRPWSRDTIACTMSATKGMTATCAHRLVERGLLELNQPVATYWPEFAAAGKGAITVRMVLSHQAGLTRLSVPVAPEKRLDWATMTDALARSEPCWPPGTRCEYHGGTFGYLVGEMIRRTDGRSLEMFFREEIAEPLKADFLMAVGPEDKHRCAEIVGPADMVGASNTGAFRAAGEGSATGHGTAEGLARVYAALARGGELDGVQLLRQETIEAATEEQPLAHGEGTADVFGLGYQLLAKIYPGLGPRSFGHTGMGGFIGLADPDRRLGFGFVMNRLGSNGAAHLLAAVYGSLAEQGILDRSTRR
ncbi:MAG: serine hydrolase domain-containing protein [Dehalococcoidia bacterium]